MKDAIEVIKVWWDATTDLRVFDDAWIGAVHLRIRAAARYLWDNPDDAALELIATVPIVAVGAVR